jgi:general secretion pathway protein I
MPKVRAFLNRLAAGVRLRSPAAGEEGFTLLEVIIAMTIMVLAFASILAVESNSISATTRAKEANIVAMLARNKMVDLEYSVEGKTFDEVKKTDAGHFDPPYESYRWETAVKEIKFPNMNFGGGGTQSGSSRSSSEDQGNQYVELLTKLVTNFFTKALREISVTVYWKRGTGESSFSVSTYWVDLNHEFETSE